MDTIYAVALFIFVEAMLVFSAIRLGMILERNWMIPKEKDISGNLVLVNDPVEGTYLFLESGEQLETLQNKKAVIFTVETREVKAPRVKQAL